MTGINVIYHIYTLSICSIIIYINPLSIESICSVIIYYLFTEHHSCSLRTSHVEKKEYIGHGIIHRTFLDSGYMIDNIDTDRYRHLWIYV